MTEGVVAVADVVALEDASPATVAGAGEGVVSGRVVADDVEAPHVTPEELDARV